MINSEFAPWFVFLGLTAYGAVALGWRAWFQYRKTGDIGVRGFPRSSAEKLALLALVLGSAAVALAPWADLAGGLPRFAVVDRPWARLFGMAIFALGFVLTVRSQLDMGRSWRLGVDVAETTTLVTGGMFRWVRNPIFTGVGLVFVGLAWVVPNLLAVLGAGLVIVGIEMQVRCVEEPYLVRVHGDRYLDFAASVGRFLPWIGRGVNVNSSQGT